MSYYDDRPEKPLTDVEKLQAAEAETFRVTLNLDIMFDQWIALQEEWGVYKAAANDLIERQRWLMGMIGTGCLTIGFILGSAM